jgi:hypothetical protein
MGQTDLFDLRCDRISARYGWTDEYILELPLERFTEIAYSARMGERLEERRWNRIMAQIAYAVWFRDAGKKRPSWKKYLKKMGLHEDPERFFMVPLEDERDADGRPKGTSQWRKADRDTKSVEEVERTLRESGELDNPADTWADLTMADLVEFKVEVEKDGKPDEHDDTQD